MSGSARNRGIGRGLAAILAVSPQADGDELREIAVELISPNSRQPRAAIADESLAALADSVRVRGVLQPVLVRPSGGGRYELIAGERRWRAAQIAGHERVPALVRSRDDAEALEVALIENMAREDLNPFDAARGCAALVEELGLSQEEVGLRVGRSRAAVSNLLRLLELPDEALAMLQTGALTEGHGRALLLSSDHSDRRRLARAASAEGWSVRALEREAREANARDGGARGTRAAKAPARHPDEEEACRAIADALGGALGVEVSVRAVRAGGFRAELRFDDVEDALTVARRMRPRAAA